MRSVATFWICSAPAGHESKRNLTSEPSLRSAPLLKRLHSCGAQSAIPNPSGSLSTLLLAFHRPLTRCQIRRHKHKHGGFTLSSDQEYRVRSETLKRRHLLSALSGATAAQALGVPSLEVAALIAQGSVDSVATLANGAKFPLASFGVQDYDESTAEKLTTLALEAGYRNIFSSVLAGNQRGVARAIRKSPVPRESIFLCGSAFSSKAVGFEKAFAATKQECERNLAAFAVGDINYIDMMMLDYPGPDCESIRGQWAALEKFLADGYTRSLAVSNFGPEQLDCILSAPDRAATPVVNQQALNPGLYGRALAEELLSENQERRVLLQAWSPLAGGRLPGSVKRTCAEIGRRYGKSAYQVALRWIVQSGAAFTVSSRSREHLNEDLLVFDFELTSEEMGRIEPGS